MIRTVVLGALIAAGFGAVIALTGPLERIKPTLPETYSDSDLSMNGSRLKGFAFGMEGLLADWYWMRALQYIGDKIIEGRKTGNIDIEDLTSLNPRLVYPMLKNATDLDPHFIGAYSYGAIVLPAIDKEKAVLLAKTGVENNPDDWKLYQHLGFIYWKLGDYANAADAYERGSQVAGASPFMALMAAAMRTEGGSRATARAIYTQMLAESADEAVRITAERRLMELAWLDEKEAINAALATFREQNGRCAASFAEIGPSLLKVSLPDGGQFRVDRSNRLVDPSGVPYRLDQQQCVVRLDPATALPYKEN